MKIHMVTFIFLMIGGLNWLLVGLFSWDVGEIFGGVDSAVSRIIYILIGLSAVYEMVTHKTCCKACDTMKKDQTAPTGSAPAV